MTLLVDVLVLSATWCFRLNRYFYVQTQYLVEWLFEMCISNIDLIFFYLLVHILIRRESNTSGFLLVISCYTLIIKKSTYSQKNFVLN
jgi:hypothetical protein